MAETELRVQVIYALPERHWAVSLRLPAGATVADAIAASGLPERVPSLVVDGQRLAVFGRAVGLAESLKDGDRVEILRPLQADPKQVRRQRAGKPV